MQIEIAYVPDSDLRSRMRENVKHMDRDQVRHYIFLLKKNPDAYVGQSNEAFGVAFLEILEEREASFN